MLGGLFDYMENSIAKNFIESLDELNILVEQQYLDDKNALVDTIESFLILGYKRGREDCEDMVDYILDTGMDLGLLNESLTKQYEGKTFRDRVEEYINDGSLAEIQRVAETEFHRMYNTGAADAAEEIAILGEFAIGKRWLTKMDNRVRETHNYLEGDVVGLTDRFYTYDGDSARFPSDFEKPENNINCRCILEYVRI